MEQLSPKAPAFFYEQQASLWEKDNLRFTYSATYYITVTLIYQMFFPAFS